MQIHVTEHKSVGALRTLTANAVRVFVDHDYHYGYFVDEAKLYDLLDPKQQVVYLQGEEARLEVSAQTAQRIIDLGVTPYAKMRVA